MKQRLLIVAWPEDHDEDIPSHALDIQDAIDLLQMGGARVIAPLPDAVHDQIIDCLGEGLP